MSAPLSRHRPLAELDAVSHRLDRYYDQWFDGKERGWTPALDVERSDDALTVRADVPGVKPDDLKIEVEDDVLTISGQHEERTEEKKGKDVIRRERHYGSFSRTMTLPAGVDASQIDAKTKDGVLELTIPLPAGQKKQSTTIKPSAA